VEDTAHFRNELTKLGKGTAADGDTESWAEQRAFDEAAASSKPSADSALPTARDHHALLQQPHVLYVSTKQRGNGVLKYIRNVPYQFATMVPDYILNTKRCALFLSCKYHSLYPEYIYRRIAELKTDFELRILLVLVDVEDNANTLLQLNKLAVQHDFTLILSWTEEEAARYLETFKALDGKDASSIQKREQSNFADQVADVLSTAKSVNKTDAAQLLSNFGTFKAIAAASMDELCTCAGMGPTKVRRLYEAFRKPFSSQQAKRRREEKRKKEEEEQGAHQKHEEDESSAKEAIAGVSLGGGEGNVESTENTTGEEQVDGSSDSVQDQERTTLDGETLAADADEHA
jgi:DNA excision repair protein ERCC-1